jgi:hypothetical protein
MLMADLRKQKEQAGPKDGGAMPPTSATSMEHQQIGGNGQYKPLMSNRELKASAKAVFLRSSVNGLSLKRYEMCLRQEESAKKKSSATMTKPSNKPDGHAEQMQGLLYGAGSLTTLNDDGVIAEERPIINE